MLLHFWLQDGFVHMYDLQTGHWVSSFQAASGINDISYLLKMWLVEFCIYPCLLITNLFICSIGYTDTVSGFSFHPFLPMAASSSGHRRFVVPDDIYEDVTLSGISSDSAANFVLLEIFSNICNVFPSSISLVELCHCFTFVFGYTASLLNGMTIWVFWPLLAT